jgi:hypothetical protein
MMLIIIKDRVSMVFVYYARIDVKDGVFVVFKECSGNFLTQYRMLRVVIGHPCQ